MEDGSSSLESVSCQFHHRHSSPNLVVLLKDVDIERSSWVIAQKEGRGSSSHATPHDTHLQAITAAAGEEEAHEKAYDDHKLNCRHTSPKKWYVGERRRGGDELWTRNTSSSLTCCLVTKIGRLNYCILEFLRWHHCLFVFRPIFARRPPKTKSRANATTGFLGVLFLAKLAMLRKNCQKLQSWTSSVQSGILKTLLQYFPASFLPYFCGWSPVHLLGKIGKQRHPG